MILLILFSFSRYISSSYGSNSVIELSDNNFSNELSKLDLSLVMFYAPWCRHCRDLKMDFEKAALTLSKNRPPITLARIDCTSNGKNTCSDLSIPGYPTLKIFRKGEFLKEYDGPRDSLGIEEYMEDEGFPVVQDLTSAESLERILEENKTVVIGFFDSESPFKQNFLKSAEGISKKRAIFGLTSYHTNLDKYKEKIVLHRPKYLHNTFEPSSVVFPDDSLLDMEANLENLILKYKHGLVGHRTKYNEDEFTHPLVVAYFDVDYKRNPKGTTYWRNRIMMIAQNFSQEFSFAISAMNEFPHELSSFGYEYDGPINLPVIFVKDNNNKIYKMKETFSVTNFEKFLSDLKIGAIKPFRRSGPILENTGKLVKDTVADNFDEVVTNNGKDSFIMFYAPWCAQCMDLKKVFERLGQEMAKEEVVIIKMDISKNDVPTPYVVEELPALYWSPKESKDTPVKYEGGWELEDFISFIAQKGSEELRGYDRKGLPKAKDEL